MLKSTTLSKFFQGLSFSTSLWMACQLWGRLSSLLWWWSFLSLVFLIYMEVKDKYKFDKNPPKEK
jgi:hypothetical protein